ncbi:MAG TPA: hypothetical protein VF149_03470 [Bacillales bacterium]
MANVLKSNKFKAITVPILMLLILGALLLYRNLQLQQVLPTEGWSRSVQLPATMPGITEQPFVQQDGEKYHIYTYNENSIGDLVIDGKLNVLKQSSIPVKVEKGASFWAKGSEIIFLDDGKLFYSDGDGRKLITSGVGGMKAVPDNIVIRKGHELYKVDPDSRKTQMIGKVQHEIQEIVLNSNHGLFLVVSKIDNTHHAVTLFRPKENGDYEKMNMPSIEHGYGLSLAGFDIAVNESELNLLYSVYSGKSRDIYLTTYNLADLQAEASVQQLLFRNKTSELPIEDVANVSISYRNQEPVLIFTGNGVLSGGLKAQSIFRAEQHKGEIWLADRISSTKEPSRVPFWLHDGAVLWLDFEGYDRHIVTGASQDPEVIEESLQLTDEDWGDAFSHMLPTLTGSLLMFFYACFLWALPVAGFLLLLIMVSLTMMERNPPWIKYVSMVLFVLMQLFFINAVLDGRFFEFAPNYLTFPGAIYVIPVLMAILSWLIVEWVKGKEWDNIGQIIYFIGLDGMILAFLMGPYMI